MCTLDIVKALKIASRYTFFSIGLLLAGASLATEGPKIATNNRAQIKELMEREATMIKRATGRTKPTLGEVLWAAKKAMGIAMNKPSKVPKVAIFRVSHMGHHNSCTEAQAGGIIREPIS